MKKVVWLLLSLSLIGCRGTVPPEEVTVLTGATATTLPAALEAPASATADVEAAMTPTVEPGSLDELEFPPIANPDLDHAKLLNDLVFPWSEGGVATLAQIRESGDPRFIAGLIDTLRYRHDLAGEIVETLEVLTGQRVEGDWFEWHEWAGNYPQIPNFEGYVAWKADLFAYLDPSFRRFVYEGMKIAPESRPEEIVWGGVHVDGIPALDNPKMIEPEAADYLAPQERVFGVSINGDSRAYPARFLDWHEMFNDVVGGEPVSLAY